MDDPRFAWKNHVTGRVEVYEVPGNHFELREEPYVRTLAERLASCLAAAAQPNEAAARKD
jgi:thioesterase domain-containing protein